MCYEGSTQSLVDLFTELDSTLPISQSYDYGKRNSVSGHGR